MSLPPDAVPARRTKRRYAHELYPQAGEWEVRALGVEVPALYARAIGMDVFGTSWFDIEPKLSIARTHDLIHAQKIALMADAMLQGLTGQEAWEWAEQRVGESGEWIYERAVHYGVNPAAIKPYPCGPAPDHHDHTGPMQNGWATVTRAEGTEEDCEECTEPIEGVTK